MSGAPTGGNAGELKNTHAVARRLLLELRALLERLERHEAPAAVLADAQRKVADLQRTSEALNNQARTASLRSGSSGAGDLWLRKATSVAEDTAQLSYALERVVSVDSAAVAEARSRSELFHRSVGGASAGGAFDAESQEVEANQQAFVSARRGNAALEELNDVAGAVLHALHAQRETLKSAQRRALDVLNTVGVSTALLGRAERRQRGDRALVACCAVGSAVLFVWLLYVTRK